MQLDFESVVQFINAVFVLRMKEGNQNDKKPVNGHKPKLEDEGLQLKGQVQSFCSQFHCQ